jgi:hemoglobin
MHIRTVLLSLLIGVSTIGVAACGGKGKGGDTMSNNGGSGAAGPSLYDRLGKKDAITAVVGTFLENVSKDDAINARFQHADLPGLKAKLIDQICEAAGGPCKYTGKKMIDAHAGMQITEADFNALVGDLVKALDQYKVGDKEKNELLGALGGMKGDIVGH